MDIKRGLLGALIGLSIGMQGVSFEQFTTQANHLSSGLAIACNSFWAGSENVPVYELYLRQLFNRPYDAILNTPWLSKKTIIDQFKADYCQNLVVDNAVVDRGHIIEINDAAIQNLNQTKVTLGASLDDANVAWVEYLLHSLGVSFDNLIKLDMAAKQLKLRNLLTFAPSSTLTTTVTNPVGPLQGGAGGAVVTDPVVIPVGSALIASSKTACVVGGALHYLGETASFCLLDDFDLNQVQLSNYPVVGKYLGGTGYPMATMDVVIKNNVISTELLKHVPVHIRSAIPTDCKTDFYTEILSWEPSKTDPLGQDFQDKERQFNLVFHGTMLDWFAKEYRTIDFTRGSISKNLAIGIFNNDGVTKVTKMGSNSLLPTDVNPHNGHYSPDNALFTVAPDRNIMTFWSVAASTTAKRAIVTYHVLINQEAYPDLVESIHRVTAESSHLSGLITGLMAAANVGGADGAAWAQAVKFLSELYRV